MNVVKNVDLLYRPTVALPKPADEVGKNNNFGVYLKDALGEVHELQGKASEAIQQMVGEGKGDLQDTMIAIEKADVSFRLMMQIRNKVLDAYQEIIRMQV